MNIRIKKRREYLRKLAITALRDTSKDDEVTARISDAVADKMEGKA